MPMTINLRGSVTPHTCCPLRIPWHFGDASDAGYCKSEEAPGDPACRSTDPLPSSV